MRFRITGQDQRRLTNLETAIDEVTSLLRDMHDGAAVLTMLWMY